MWTRFAKSLRCPLTGEALELVAFNEQRERLSPQHLRRAESFGLRVDDQFATRVESGLLLAESGRVAYPIARGLPVMLPYETAIHRQFEQAHARELRPFRPRYAFPSLEPKPGEQAVLRSFSKEWADYRYDGVIWDVSYEDNQQRFRAEIGVDESPRPGATFLEVGCGIG